MPRKPQHPPLSVLQNNQRVGSLRKEASGAIEFHYDSGWLSRPGSFPISLSLPLREDRYRGAAVAAVFENLLPDSAALRRRIAARVGASGTDAYSMLLQIGRDCVGALRFVVDDGGIGDPEPDPAGMQGERIGDGEIEELLGNLVQAPLGIDDTFRISVAGAQEKTALLWRRGRWEKPVGATPTSHIFKKQIGRLPNGIDLSLSVENEFYCLNLLAAFGLPVNAAQMRAFGKIRALVIERFDRHWTSDGRLLRLPQEDCCQALSVSPDQKYQSDGGPGMVDVLNLLKGSDEPETDHRTFLKAQILFWLMGATDGHAKNFSIFIGPGGSFRLTPLYDVLSAQPSLDARKIVDKQMKLAMFVGDSRHYVMKYIKGRHFVQSTERAGLPGRLAQEVLEEVADLSGEVFKTVSARLPDHFPRQIHASVRKGFVSRLGNI